MCISDLVQCVGRGQGASDCWVFMETTNLHSRFQWLYLSHCAHLFRRAEMDHICKTGPAEHGDERTWDFYTGNLGLGIASWIPNVDFTSIYFSLLQFEYIGLCTCICKYTCVCACIYIYIHIAVVVGGSTEITFRCYKKKIGSLLFVCLFGW